MGYAIGNGLKIEWKSKMQNSNYTKRRIDLIIILRFRRNRMK